MLPGTSRIRRSSGEVEALANGADLVRGEEALILAVDGDGVLAEAPGVLVAEENLAAPGAAQVSQVLVKRDDDAFSAKDDLDVQHLVVERGLEDVSGTGATFSVSWPFSSRTACPTCRVLTADRLSPL